MSKVILFPRTIASAPPAPRLTTPEECPDLDRSLRILRRGLPDADADAVHSLSAAAWEKWSATAFTAECVPHLLRACRAASAGRSAELLAADRAQPFPPEAAGPAVPLRAWQDLAVILPCARGLAAAVADGTAPGHLHALYACRAAAFHLGELLLLQSVLFAEWLAAGAPAGRLKSPDEFLRASRPAWDILPRLLFSNDAPATPRATSRRRAD